MCYVIYKQAEDGSQEAVCYLHDRETAKRFAEYVEEVENSDINVVPYRLAEAVRQRITYFEKVLDRYAPKQ